MNRPVPQASYYYQVLEDSRQNNLYLMGVHEGILSFLVSLKIPSHEKTRRFEIYNTLFFLHLHFNCLTFTLAQSGG